LLFAACFAAFCFAACCLLVAAVLLVVTCYLCCCEERGGGGWCISTSAAALLVLYTELPSYDVNFSPIFFLIAFSGVSQRWEFKSTKKNVLQKKSCYKVFTKNSTKNPKPIFFSIFLKSFYKKIDQKSQTDFFLDFLLSRFWVLLGEG
jgi:hypothetical protein